MWLYFGASDEEAELLRFVLGAERPRIQVAVPGSVGAAFDLIRSREHSVEMLVVSVSPDPNRLSGVLDFLLFQQALNSFPVVALCSGRRGLEIAQRIGFNQCVDRGSTTEELGTASRQIRDFAASKQRPAPPSDKPALGRNPVRCMSFTLDGARCRRVTSGRTRFCLQHGIKSSSQTDLSRPTHPRTGTSTAPHPHECL
jgi:hypothetical protein